MRGYDASREEIDALINLYDVYDASPAAPSENLKGAAFPEELITALQAAYSLTQTGRRLQHVRALVFSDIELCPICGIGAPGELDHFLPQSEFKTLAIYVRNLIPLCHDCNGIKRVAYSDQPEQRLIHAYLEILPDIGFLKAATTLEHGGLDVIYEIDPNAAVPELLRARLSFQLDKLKLNDRYRKEINIYTSSHAVSLRMAYDAGGADGVRTFLNSQAMYEIARFHRNHWRPVLLMALVECQDFCDGGFADILLLPDEFLADFAEAEAATT